MNNSEYTYSLDDIMALEACESRFAFDRTTPPASSSNRMQPLQIVTRSATMAFVLLGGSPLNATPIPATDSVESIMLTTNQAILATTQSRQFKRLVRGLAVADEQEEDSEIKNAYAERIDLLSALEADWDGYEAECVNSEAIKNAKDIVQKLSVKYVKSLDIDNIDPTADGTITIQWNLSGDNYFLIEVGKSKVVYFYEVNDCLGGQSLPILYEGSETVQKIEQVLAKVIDK